MQQSFSQKYGSQTEIRALSWKEPFASLMLKGKIETRTWNTKYRGWVLICAGLKPYDNFELLKIAGDRQFGRIEEQSLKETKGHAIAIGRLVNSELVDAWAEHKFVEGIGDYSKLINNKKFREQEEKCFVKLRSGLWMHTYEDVQEIVPLPWKGQQGFKIVDEETKDKIIFV